MHSVSKQTWHMTNSNTSMPCTKLESTPATPQVGFLARDVEVAAAARGRLQGFLFLLRSLLNLLDELLPLLLLLRRDMGWDVVHACMPAKSRS